MGQVVDILKPIPTFWNGRYFRSRLEARWAVFYDTVGIKYEYEKEGYDLGNGVKYLPDFWMTDLKFWVEIKPLPPTEEETEKASKLVRSCGLSLYMAIEPIGNVMPWPVEPTKLVDCNLGDDPPKHEAFFENDTQDSGYLWTACPNPRCQEVGIQYEGRSHLLCGCQAGAGKEGRDEQRCFRLILGYARALAERFDKK